MDSKLVYLIFVGLTCILHTACSLFYKECEFAPPDAILQATIAGNKEEINVWYGVPVEGALLHIYQPTHASQNSQLTRSLSSIGISRDDLGISKSDSVVAVEYFLKDTACIIELKNQDCFHAALVFYTRNETLQTRFFYMEDEGPRLLEKVNATPKYLSSNNGYKALELLPTTSQPIMYLKMVDPSEANRARKGKDGDFLMKVNAYLEANKK